jgi:hypothetical protein
MASCLGGHVENAASWVWYAQDLKQDADAGPFMGPVRRMQQDLEMDPTSVMMVGREGTRHPRCFVFLSALTAALSLSSGAICLHATRSLSKSPDGVPDCPYEPSDIAGSAVGSRGRVDPFTAERWADAVDAGSRCAWAMLVCGGIGLLGTYQKANLVCKAAGSNKSTPESVACARCIYFVCAWIEVVFCILFLRTYGNFRKLHSDDSEMPWLSITDNYDDCQDSDPELHQLARVRLVVVWLLAPVAFFYKWVLVLMCCCTCICGVAAAHDDRATAEARREYSTAASDDAAIDDVAAMLDVLGVLGASAASSASRDRDIEGAIAAGILGLGSAVASAGATRSEPAVVVSNTPGAPTIEESLEVDGAMSRLSSVATDAFETPPTSPRGQAANP